MASNYHGGGYGSGRGRGRHHRFHRGGGRRGFRGSRSSDYGDGFGERRDYSDMAESGGYRRRGQHGGAAVAEDGNNFEEDRGRDGDRRGRKNWRSGLPPGLRGKEIGMFFARRGQQRRKEQELQNRKVIQMDRGKEERLSNLLSSIKSEDKVAPQPTRSYRNAFDDTDEVDDTPSSAVASGSADPTPNSWESLAWHDDDSQTHSKPQEKNSYEEIFKRPWICEEEWDEDNISDDSMGKTEADSSLELDESDATDEELHEAANLAEMFQIQADDSDFMAEFKSHNLQNRMHFQLQNAENRPDDGLVRDEALDRRLLQDLESKENSPRFQKMMEFRKKLPSYEMRETIVEHMNRNQVLVISGETGCGKTTQVAQFILDDYIKRGDGSLCRVVCTQPRRISAISVAERVADERAEACGGESVGYQIRLESKLPRQRGSILYCTTGIMLKWLVSDRWLQGTTHVILDEIHERDLHSDFLMIILKDLVRVRPDLKLVLMSATLNAEQFSEYYGGCPMLNIPGFTYPVEEYLLEDVVELLGFSKMGPSRPQKRVHGKKRWEKEEEKHRLECWIDQLDPRKYSDNTKSALSNFDYEKVVDLDLIHELVRHIMLNKPEGAILIFVPGMAQISDINKKLESDQMFRSGKTRIIPLHSLMPTINQKEIFHRPPPGVRKIVIATNIAETSITIDDVVYVIDCGQIKLTNFDVSNNVSTLLPQPVSRANARQRRGRAGRVQPGECYHLYTAYQEEQFADYQLPEILRTRLEELCLQIKMLKLGRIMPFVKKAMQPPSAEAMELSIQMLRDLNALDDNEDLTPLGYHLAKMPVDPQTGKMLLLGAMFSCLDPILTVAASLSFKDAFYIPLGKEKAADQRRRMLAGGTQSDHLMLVRAYQGWEKAQRRGDAQHYCFDNFLSQNTLKMLRDMRKQFTELLRDMKFVSSDAPAAPDVNKFSTDYKIVKAVICAGLYPNVAKVVRVSKSTNYFKPPSVSTKHERKLAIHPKSVNAEEKQFESEWLVYHLKMKSTKIYLHDCSTVTPYSLLFFGGDIDVRKDSGQDCIVVDDWITFRASPRIAHLVKELRGELNKLLEYKITHPGVTSWNPRVREGALMNAIFELLTTEDYAPPPNRGFDTNRF